MSVMLDDWGSRLQAHEARTSELLGTATRSNGDRDEWVGWLVDVAGEHEVLPTKVAAKAALRAKAEWLLQKREDAAAGGGS